MKSENLNQRMKKSTRTLFIWTSSWVISLATVTFAPRFVWDFAQTFTLIAVGLNIFFGYKMIIANKLHLEAMDELQRRIHLNAMAITLGVTVVFTALYSLVDDIKLISFEPDPSSVLFVMSITYMACVFIGTRKYS